MLSIKLSRFGKKKQPAYRMLVLPKTKDPWGDYIENVGFYNPLTNPKTIELKAERIKYWLSVGAQPSATVHNLLVRQGIVDAKKRQVTTISKKRALKLAEKQKAESPAQAKEEPQKTDKSDEAD